MNMLDLYVEYHEWVGYGMVITSIITFFAVMFKTAPYGRHSSATSSKYWGPPINAVLAWMIMEAPSPIFMAIYFFRASEPLTITRLILFILFVRELGGVYFHYSRKSQNCFSCLPS